MKHPGILVVIAGATLPLVAACGASHPTASPSHRPAPAVSAAAGQAAADCSKLTAAAFAPAAYDKLVVTETSRIAGSGNASASQVQAARAKVAAEIRASCPQFAYLLPGS